MENWNLHIAKTVVLPAFFANFDIKLNGIEAARHPFNPLSWDIKLIMYTYL